MNHIPSVDGKSHSTCVDPVRELFARKSILERLDSVMAELLWLIQGDPNFERHERILPAYCYNILKIFRKTYFKILAESDRCVLRDGGETDWDALGKMLGVGLHCLSFATLDLNVITGSQQLSANDSLQIKSMIDALPCQRSAETLWAAFLAANKAANERGAEAVAKLTDAIEKGRRGFIDRDGQCVGESRRANLYWFFLLAWPEIQDLQNRCPPISRAGFNDWLQPFAERGMVCVPHFGQLVDVCDNIGLKFKGAGAPREK